MDWVSIGVSVGIIAGLAGLVVGYFYLVKKSPKAKEIMDLLVQVLPLVNEVVGKGVAHDVLNMVKHTAKTASFLLENKDADFADVKDEMEEYVKKCLALAGKEVPDDILEAELRTAHAFMKNSLG